MRCVSFFSIFTKKTCRYVWFGPVTDTLHQRLFNGTNSGCDTFEPDAFGQIDLDQQSDRNSYACRWLRDPFQCLILHCSYLTSIAYVDVGNCIILIKIRIHTRNATIKFIRVWIVQRNVAGFCSETDSVSTYLFQSFLFCSLISYQSQCVILIVNAKASTNQSSHLLLFFFFFESFTFLLFISMRFATSFPLWKQSNFYFFALSLVLDYFYSLLHTFISKNLTLYWIKKLSIILKIGVALKRRSPTSTRVLFRGTNKNWIEIDTIRIC